MENMEVPPFYPSLFYLLLFYCDYGSNYSIQWDLQYKMLEAHVLAIVILGVSSFIVGSIPLKLARCAHQPLILSLLLCFGAGVLLATSIIHMLGEVREKLPEYSELLFCSGFLVLYALDELIHLCVQDDHTAEKYEKTSPRRSRISSSSSGDGLMHSSSSFHRQRKSYGTIETSTIIPELSSTSSHHIDYSLFSDQASIGGTNQGSCCRSHKKERSYHRAAWKAEHSTSEAAIKMADSELSSESSISLSDEHVDHCHVEVQKPCAQSKSSLAGLLGALLVHAILEGCSIGVQTKSKQILLVLAAIACHKLVLAFCLGLELAAAGYEGFKFIIALTAFSVGCPIGIGIGVSITHSSEGIFFLEAPLQALAAGSLLYVAVFEVLPRERYKWQHKENNKFASFYQMIFVILGFSAIVLLSIFADYHGHDSPA